MTTYNLLILDKMIQYHYETNAVIRPTQEEVETAMRGITNEIDDLKRLNAELLLTLNRVKNRLKSEDRTDSIEAMEILLDGAINTAERQVL